MSKSSLREVRAGNKTVEYACHWLTAFRSLRAAGFAPLIRISPLLSSPSSFRFQACRRLEFTNICHVSGSERFDIRREVFSRGCHMKGRSVGAH